jgi:hypothetical protein
LAAVAVVIAMLLTTIAAFGGLGGDDDETRTTTTTTGSLSTEDLSDEAQQLVALLQAARDETYHASFEGSSPETGESAIRLETWQRPPRVRQDSQLSAAGQLARTSSFVLPEGGVRCTQLADAPWSCRAAQEGELGGDVVSASVLEQLEDSDVGLRSTQIDDVAVTCFTLTTRSGPTEGSSSELCLDERGITVRVRSGESELHRIELSSTFDDGVFEPPASVA